MLASILQILQTSLNGLAYYGILAYAYPGRVQLWPIITAYAVGVSMNNFLPANIGTFVTLLMFVAIIPGSNFPGVFAAYLVNKIFFTIVGGFVYLYLFIEAGEAFDVELGWFHDHPPAAPAWTDRRCRVPDRDRRSHLLALAEEALGPGEGRRQDPLSPPARIRSACSCHSSAATRRRWA